MSRNVRHRSDITPSKKTVRSSARNTDNSSDDDDYAGVDLISDSEEDEPDVEVAEEQAIIASLEDSNDDATPRPSIEDDDVNFDELEQPDVLGDVPFFDEQIARMNTPDHDTEATAWISTKGHSQVENTRRVRFDLSDTSTVQSDDDDNIFPDIFLDQNSLDPAFRRIIEDDNEDEPGPPSDEGSYWDFQGSEAGDVAEGSDDDDSTGSSGYETDDGETTDEDLPEEAQFAPTLEILPRQSAESSDSEEEVAIVRRRPRRRGPKLASWVHDASKPFAVLDSHGKRLIMYKAKINRRYSFSGTGSRSHLSFTPGSDQESPRTQLSPMISNSANLMMTAMYTQLDPYGGQVLGPPEAFYPFTSISADGTVAQDSATSYDDDDLDDEDLWHIEDFLDLDEANSEGDDREVVHVQEDDSGNTTDQLNSTPARPTTATSEDQVHPLLDHFSDGAVGAWRRNQTQQKLVRSGSVTHESLDFAGPHGQGVLRGIKGGRLEAANTPITPLRRQKVAAALPSSPASPLASIAQKRKFSGEQQGHKRTRSLV